jgi:hypothetical protein
MIQEQDENLTPEQLAAVQVQRQKKGLATATGNPLDKVVTNPQEVDKKVQTEETLIERVVSMMQRRKRALQMKRSKPRTVRARNIKKTRLATQDQLMRRAMRMAKTMLRKRAAGARGANYSKLSPAQKMNIDRQVEPRAKNIKAIATRLMPRVKAGEMKRLNAVRTHKSTKGVYGNVQNLTQSFEPVLYSKILGERVSSEDLNAMFSMYEGFVSSALAPVRLATKIVGGAATTAAALQTPQSTAAGLGAATLYGYKKLSNLGKEDADKKKKDKSDKYSDKINQQSLIQSKERTKQALLKTKQMQQKPSKNIVAHKEWDYETYLQEKAAQHLQKKADKYGVSLEEVTDVFEQGLADYIQNNKTTPHQFAMQRVNSHLTVESLDESFIVDRASGYSGVYTARDLGMKIQGGFQLHPSVEEEIGAGFEGTNQLTNKYKKDTPGETVEAFARMMRAKRKANTPC